MWIQVLYDLPVVTRDERRAARKFHDFLLDQGFEMAQYSVYMRLLAGGKEQLETMTRRISANAPPYGKVTLLAFTDKQYENMICFRRGTLDGPQKNPEQYLQL